jgi:hypothetical protein
MKCKRDVYFALIYSILTYCIQVYANVAKSVINPLLIKCNRLLRLLHLKLRNTPVLDLYSSFDTLPINSLFEYHTAKFLHKCLYNNSQIPITVTNWFIRGNSLHTHNTRHCEHFLIRSDLNPKSIFFYGPVKWSKIPSHLQNNPSLASFLKNYISIF